MKCGMICFLCLDKNQNCLPLDTTILGGLVMYAKISNQIAEFLEGPYLKKDVMYGVQYCFTCSKKVTFAYHSYII